MSKITFKRIALAVVTALSFGLLSGAPTANAALDETLTLSAASATINLGETASVTITNTFISETASVIGGLATAQDSRVVFVSGASAGGSVLAKHTSDSANTSMSSTKEVTVTTTGVGAPTFAESVIATNANAFTKQTITLKFYQVATAGTYIYTITTRNAAGTTSYKTATFTLTVTDNTAPAASTSKAYLNKALAAQL